MAGIDESVDVLADRHGKVSGCQLNDKRPPTTTRYDDGGLHEKKQIQNNNTTKKRGKKADKSTLVCFDRLSAYPRRREHEQSPWQLKNHKRLAFPQRPTLTDGDLLSIHEQSRRVRTFSVTNATHGIASP